MQVSEVLRVKGNTLFTVTPDTMLSDCVVTMAEHDIGSLVVMERGKLAGMLTFREVLQVLARRQLEHRTGPTRVSGLPVVDEDGRLLGICTNRDLRFTPVAEWERTLVRDVMNPEPEVAVPAMEVNELRRLMLEHHQRYVPVMDGETLLGVVSFHDVAKAVLEEQGFENRMLKAYIRDWPAEG